MNKEGSLGYLNQSSLATRTSKEGGIIAELGQADADQMSWQTFQQQLSVAFVHSCDSGSLGDISYHQASVHVIPSRTASRLYSFVRA